MATFTKKILSGSTDGKGIKVVATATAGTLIHTGSTTAATLQEVWLWACNTSSADVLLTIEWGDAVTPDGNIKQTITFQKGEQIIIPGFILKGNATPLTIKAFAATANVIVIKGYINEIA